MDPEKETTLENKEELSKALHTKDGLPSLRTYQGDIASFIQSKDKSVAEVALKNREEKEKREKQEEEGERKNFFAPVQTTEEIKAQHKQEKEEEFKKMEPKSPSFLIYVLGIVLLTASLGVGAYLWWVRAKDAPLTIVNTNTALIRTEHTIVLDASNLNKEAFDTAIVSAKNNPAYAKGVTRVELSAPASDFINKVKWSIPSPLTRSLAPEFIVGITSAGLRPDFFVILKVKDYGIAFRDMLNWEDLMAPDFNSFMNASSTAIANYTWKDLIVKNKDARSLSSKTGATALIYTFINQNTILITESEASMTSLVNSFVSGNAVR